MDELYYVVRSRALIVLSLAFASGLSTSALALAPFFLA